MVEKKFSGIIRIDRKAKLETPNGTWILSPYPSDAPIEKEVMDWEGRQLFVYLKDRSATVVGDLQDNRLYNARVAISHLALKDVRLAPESHDRFSKEIESYFKRDSAVIAARLNQAGILTVSAFYHRIKNFAPEISAFSKYLAVPEASIKQFIGSIEAKPGNKSLITAPPKIPVSRGINLKNVIRIAGVPVKRHAPAEPPSFPDSQETPSLPSEVSLTKEVTRIRDQGPFRGTCVAHTAVAMLEYELVRKNRVRKNTFDLSEQYLYWGCKQLDGAAKQEGTFIEYAVEVLKQGVHQYPPGVCRERSWPYVTASIAGNEAQDPPPFQDSQAKQLVKSGNFFKISKHDKLDHRSIKEIKTALADNHCVGLSVYTYHFWTDGYAWREGVISMPVRIPPDGAHAICLVGYEDADGTHRDGQFIFKNSWGKNWAGGRADAGFGRLPYRYVLKESIEAWVVSL